MKHQFEHLTASTAELLNLSNDLRIREVQSERWVHYPEGKGRARRHGPIGGASEDDPDASVAIYGDSGLAT